jgi:Zn-dependent protease with chaperone function
MDGVSSFWVKPIVFSITQVERSRTYRPYAKYIRNTPAFAYGGTVPAQIAGYRIADKPLAVGLIGIEQSLEDILSSEEMEFVLAHEFSHILMNHSPYEYLGGYGSRLVKNRIARIESRALKTIVSLAWNSLVTRVRTRFTKESELAADAHAAQLIGNNYIARSTIEKLVQQFADGNANLPCHYEVRNGRLVTVLTYSERLDALSTRF